MLIQRLRIACGDNNNLYPPISFYEGEGENLNIDGSPIPYTIPGSQVHVYTETHGRGHDGLDDHNGKPFK